MPAYDVVIVGARVAGAATAHLLARFGLRVLLLERGHYGTDTLSTHALMRAGVLQLYRWGLLDKVIAAGTPPVRRTTFRYADTVVPININPSYGVDALYAPRRTVLDPILVDAAIAGGVEVRFGVTVTDVERDSRGNVTGVVGRTVNGQAFSAQARFVVGADGIRSTIAGQVGAALERVGKSVPTLTYGYWTGLASDAYEWNYRPGATSGVIPTNDGQACVFVSGSSRPVGRGWQQFHQIVAESSPDLADRLAAATPPRTLRRFSGQPGYIRRSWGPGWALVGDAGYYKDPLTSHGMTDALRDAELLARALVAILADGADERETLAGYQRTRDALSVAFFDITDVIAGHRWTLEEIPDLLRQARAANAGEVDALTALPPLPSPPCATPWRSGGSPDPDQTCETARLGDQAVSTRRR